MKINNLSKNIKSIGLALSLVVGFLLISGVNTHAQYPTRQNDRNQDRYDNNGGNMYRAAMQKGYEDGMKQGFKEARNKRNMNSEDNASYRIAGRGYQSRYGNRNSFSNAYRMGFTRGYNEAFERYARNNRDKWNRRDRDHGPYSN